VYVLYDRLDGTFAGLFPGEETYRLGANFQTAHRFHSRLEAWSAAKVWFQGRHMEVRRDRTSKGPPHDPDLPFRS
jgi:hypothetical protein